MEYIVNLTVIKQNNVKLRFTGRIFVEYYEPKERLEQIDWDVRKKVSEELNISRNDLIEGNHFVYNVDEYIPQLHDSLFEEKEPEEDVWIFNKTEK